MRVGRALNPRVFRMIITNFVDQAMDNRLDFVTFNSARNRVEQLRYVCMYVPKVGL